MATIDDERCKLLAGQTRRIQSDVRHARELVRQGERDEAVKTLDTVEQYANYVAAWLEDVTQPPRDVPMRGKSRRR